MSSTFSIVLTGRNDNHNGDFNRRAELAIRHNAALLKAHGLAVDWVWVEWNPLPDRPLFAEMLRQWVSPLRAFVVPPALHRHLCDNPHMGVMQFLAKNAGIRRARGEWILSMNADTYLTEEVVSVMRPETLDQNVLHLATRVDFDRRHINEKPAAYPIPALEQRTVLRSSEIRLPHGFGSAGDFTLLHRELFLKTQGHFEGIRFSNNHLDTLLGRQVGAMGGAFRILGRVFHADHADSWNNFTLDDVFAHHHGADYNSMKIAAPYRNADDWGLAGFPEKEISEGVRELGAPSGMKLRAALPETMVIPPELQGVAQASRQLVAALKEIRTKSLKVVIFGLGEQLKQSLFQGVLKDVDVRGYLDEKPSTGEPIPCRRLTWQELKDVEYDVLLLGSFYWAEELRAKALAHVAQERILPKSE